MQRLVGHERLRGCVGHPRYALARLRVTEEVACAACWSADKGYAHAHCFDNPGGPSLDEERIDRTVQVLEERRAEIAGNRSVEHVALRTRLR
jgi:hypothetical protein